MVNDEGARFYDVPPWSQELLDAFPILLGRYVTGQNVHRCYVLRIPAEQDQNGQEKLGLSLYFHGYDTASKEPDVVCLLDLSLARAFHAALGEELNRPSLSES